MKSTITSLLLMLAAMLCSCSESEFERDYPIEEAQTLYGSTRNDSVGDGTGRSALTIDLDDDVEEIDIDFNLDL